MKRGKILGTGNTAIVYEWEEDKVLKLFNRGYPKKAVEKEFHNAKAISNVDFPKPRAHEIILLEEQAGIIYDKIKGESLLDWVIKTGDLQGCAAYMAKLHKAIVRNKITGVPNYKEFLKYNIMNSPLSDFRKQKEALYILDKLEDGNTLCHGDFHPGNIFISDGQTTVIDFMNVCYGSSMYDVARTVFLVEYTPVSAEVEDRKRLLQFKKTLADLYLMKMNITREMIQDYLSVIVAARAGECPNEQVNIM